MNKTAIIIGGLALLLGVLNLALHFQLYQGTGIGFQGEGEVVLSDEGLIIERDGARAELRADGLWFRRGGEPEEVYEARLDAPGGLYMKREAPDIERRAHLSTGGFGIEEQVTDPRDDERWLGQRVKITPHQWSPPPRVLARDRVYDHPAWVGHYDHFAVEPAAEDATE